jgi:hypothetical protein
LLPERSSAENRAYLGCWPGAYPAPVATAPATTTTEQPTKKKKPAKMTRQQEIDKSIDSGTVPARYRKSVPKEYQQYIPFAK